MPPLSECCEISVKFQLSLFDSPSLKKNVRLRKQQKMVKSVFYHAECGFDCTFLTPPSTGTEMETFNKGDGDAIE